MSNIIKAVFTGRFCTTRRIWRWDTDDKLQFVNLDLPQNYTVDFANSLTGQSVPVLATSDTVQIPPDMFVPGSEIYAWVWISDTNGGHTKCQTTIPVDPRAQRTGAEPTPAQASAWDQAVQTLNDAAADYETAASHAPIIQNGYWFIWDSTAGEYVTTDVKAVGIDGENGNIIWWTTEKVLADGDNAKTLRRWLNGPDGLTPAVDDYVFGPAIGSDGDPSTLYVIKASAVVVTMTALGSIVGTPGQDGYSPDVTITEITGGHRVTITDEDHPQGQSFDVMDGTGGGGTGDYDELTNKPQIAGVTLSGNKSLADLGIAAASDIPTVPVQSVNGKTGAVVLNASDVGAGTYSKPTGGIPASDLAAAVQTSLGKADTALQSYTETDPTVPSWAKASSKPSYTASEVGAIAAPASPASGAFLVWNGSAWVAQTLATWQASSY